MKEIKGDELEPEEEQIEEINQKQEQQDEKNAVNWAKYGNVEIYKGAPKL